MQTALLLCVADSHPGMFKTLAACKLEIISSEFGEDSIQVWAAITVSAPLYAGYKSPLNALVCYYLCQRTHSVASLLWAWYQCTVL